MVLSFLQYRLPQENPIYIDGVLVQTVSSFKLLEVMLTSFLSWSDQVDYVIKKTNSRLYALRQLKKAGLIVGDLVVIYSTFIRSCSEYAPPAWSALTKNQSDVIESIQKKALRIIIPGMSYSDALKATGLGTLCNRRQNSCKSFMNKFKFDSSSVNPLSGVIARQPDVNIHNYDLRYDPNTMQKPCKLLEVIIAWAVSDEIEKLSEEKCCGFEHDHPSQRQHDCLMLTVEKNGQHTVWKQWKE